MTAPRPIQTAGGLVTLVRLTHGELWIVNPDDDRAPHLDDVVFGLLPRRRGHRDRWWWWPRGRISDDHGPYRGLADAVRAADAELRNRNQPQSTGDPHHAGHVHDR